MNRVNRFILIFVSITLSFIVVYLYVRESIEKEPGTIIAPFKIEVYRVDRYPLPHADIYLNQRFLGKADERGFFQEDVKLMVGESYTLRIERDSAGYVYGPWETHFKVEEEKRKKPEKKRPEEKTEPSLEGEFDILTELERAQLGKASLYEKYNFLAILDGYMFYTLMVFGKNQRIVEDATVIINGNQEGKTDDSGLYVVKYSGEDRHIENIKILKEGEHIWMNDVFIQPDEIINVKLDKMLLIDVSLYTEYYDTIEGIEGAEIYLGQDYMGKTDRAGLCSFRYENVNGVDGYLELMIHYPQGFIPDKLRKSFFIKKDLSKLSVVDFTYDEKPVSPKIAVFPLNVENKEDYLMTKRSINLKTSIEDYLSLGDIFTVVPEKRAQKLFHQFNIDYRKDISWKEIPLLKNEVDAIIFGKISGIENLIDIELYVKDYNGETIMVKKSELSLRELQSFAEVFVQDLKNNYPFEGNITSINKLIFLNLGRRFGVRRGHKFYCFYNYFDDVKKDYSKKTVAKLKIIDTGEMISASELESINEGYLLEAGIKVKRYREPIMKEEIIPVTLTVTSNNNRIPDANVYLDDHWFGQTNREGEVVFFLQENTQIELMIYKEGYLPSEIDVKVQKDQNNLEVELKQGQTRFFINSVPEGALVYIDGEYNGTTPITENPIVLPYGFHLLELEMKGYKKYRNYINFNEKKLSFTQESSIFLFTDFLKEAEESYKKGEIEETIALLGAVPDDHPDYSRALDFLGFIYLNDIKDFKKSIEYYSRVVNILNEGFTTGESIFSYYNLAQAYYSEAEESFYTDESLAQYNFRKAISNFQFIRERKNRIPVQKRRYMYQNTLFYLAVSYQKIYYLTGKDEYLSQAYYSWMSYFDFFDKNLLEDNYFKRQYSIAETYREEVHRLKSEE